MFLRYKVFEGLTDTTVNDQEKKENFIYSCAVLVDLIVALCVRSHGLHGRFLNVDIGNNNTELLCFLSSIP